MFCNVQHMALSAGGVPDVALCCWCGRCQRGGRRHTGQFTWSSAAAFEGRTVF